jgi:hypothetical protein
LNRLGASISLVEIGRSFPRSKEVRFFCIIDQGADFTACRIINFLRPSVLLKEG